MVTFLELLGALSNLVKSAEGVAEAMENSDLADMVAAGYSSQQEDDA